MTELSNPVKASVAASDANVGSVIAQAWALLEAVPDPEIPVVSIRELGILRDVRACATHDVEVIITPTYSGCPAMDTIAADVVKALSTQDITAKISFQLAPAWTTDWITADAHRKLREYGIAPPATLAENLAISTNSASGLLRFVPKTQIDAAVACPQCGSHSTTALSHYGSTACKALYKCLACAEPFDYFKPH